MINLPLKFKLENLEAKKNNKQTNNYILDITISQFDNSKLYPDFLNQYAKPEQYQFFLF
jgi:hypothetical protein